MRWFPWSDTDGTKTEIAIERQPDGKKRLLVRQVTDHKRLNAIFDANHQLSVDNHIANAIRGNTQRHRVHVGRIDVALYWQWRRELGNPHLDPAAARKWKQRLNDGQYRAFRTSEGNI